MSPKRTFEHDRWLETFLKIIITYSDDNVEPKGDSDRLTATEYKTLGVESLDLMRRLSAPDLDKVSAEPLLARLTKVRDILELDLSSTTAKLVKPS